MQYWEVQSDAKNKGMTSFCCSAFIMSSTTFNYEPLKNLTTLARCNSGEGGGGGGGGPGNSWWGYAAWFSKFWPYFRPNTRDFKIQRRGRQRERKKKTIGLISKKQLCTCITLFCTFLSRFCTTTTWKCLISRFMENVNKQRRNFISLSELEYSSLKFSFRRVRLQLTK